MKFSELKECPFCGSDEYYSKTRVAGLVCYNMRFDGKEADNESMYEGLATGIDTGKRYCRRCNEYLGNIYDNTVGYKARLAELKGGAE